MNTHCNHVRRFVVGAGVLLVGSVMSWATLSSSGSDSIRIVPSNGRFTVEAKDVMLSDLLGALETFGAAKTTLDPRLDRKVTVSLKDATVEDVLSSVSSGQAFVYEKVGNEYRLVQASLTATQAAVPLAPVAPLSDAERAFLEERHIVHNVTTSLKALRTRTSKALLLNNAVVDGSRVTDKRVDLAIPSELKARTDTTTYIVQFGGPVTAGDRQALTDAGAQVLHYVPNNAFAVRVAPAALESIRGLASVQLVEAYHPYFKFNADLLTEAVGQPNERAKAAMADGKITVMAFRNADVSAIEALPGVDVVQSQTVDDRATLELKMEDPSQLGQLAQLDAVQWIEPTVVRKTMNDLATKRVRASALKSRYPGLDGSGVIVSLNDSGVDYVNPGFAIDPSQPTSTGVNTRIKYYDHRTGGLTADGLPGDTEGHGTHVAGSILGNGALSDTVISSPGSKGPPYGTNQFAGVAPGAQLVVLEDFNTFTDQEMASTAYAQGARISNNSWGADVFEYGSLSANWDALVIDADANTAGRQELIAFFAAGNAGGGADDGTGGTAGTVGQPGNAKNVISVGAVEQPRRADNIMGVNINGVPYNSVEKTDSDWQVSNFSSRGPVSGTDLRVKPDIVAPGSYVGSIQSHEVLTDQFLGPGFIYDYRYRNVDTGTNFAFFSGTSMATPVAAGSAALIYQNYTNAYGRAPSPALMKALMVGGARMLNTLTYRFASFGAEPSLVDQGWGLVDVSRAVDGMPGATAGDSFVLVSDQDDSLDTGETRTYSITAPSDGTGFRIVLAWTDPAGTPGNAVQLVNDIDLAVKGPGGSGYLGNFFRSDGVNSELVAPLDQYLIFGLGDGFNNVEVINVPDPIPGQTYTITVYGYNVPNGPQSYAIAAMQGLGFEGFTMGNEPDMVIDSDGNPIVAYSADGSVEGGQSNLTRQIFVKRWKGSFGDDADLSQWLRLDDQWFAIGDSMAPDLGVSRSFENSVDPSVAAKGSSVYVAWRERPQNIGGTNISHVFLRYYNGTNWNELGSSAHGSGIDGSTSLDAFSPKVGVMADGQPVVAWLQYVTNTLINVRVAKWSGAAWVGLGGSLSGLAMTFTNTMNVAEDLSLTINSAGNPVVAWHEVAAGQNKSTISVRRWNGATWDNINYSNALFYITNPEIAASSSSADLYLTWRQQVSGSSSFHNHQIFAARHTGGVWTEMSGSATFPGVSAASNSVGSIYPYEPDISIRGTNVFVSWRAGNTNGNYIFVRRWWPGASGWSSVFGGGEIPGIGVWAEQAGYPTMGIDQFGLPFVTFEAAGAASNQSYVATYTVIADREAPDFAGLVTAVGGTNQNVTLSWLPATDNLSSTIVYRIYRGSTTYPCGSTPSCNETNVFATLITTVTNTTTFNMTGLSNGLVYCFGVRAGDTNGIFESNLVVRSAGPISGAGDSDADCLINALELAVGTEACIKDTDGDGMEDGWEWTYSTNNPAHPSFTNPAAIHLDPLDNGTDKVRTVVLNDGDPDQMPTADIDGDGASNFEEYQWWLQFTHTGGFCEASSPTNRASPDPTVFDTEGDGMADGYEIFNGLNPLVNDAAADLDGDTLTNLQEYQAGTDPRNTDSDGDQLRDDVEVALGTDPRIADTDADGLDDGYEVNVSLSSPLRADSNGDFLSDGDAVQLGVSVTGVVQSFRMFVNESFETNATWTTYPLSGPAFYNMWHVSTVDPAPRTNALNVTYFTDRTTNKSYRSAVDVTGTNVDANYSIGVPVAMALQAPTITTAAQNAVTLFVAWNEYYETEPNFDQTVVQVRGGASTNWVNVSAVMSGLSGVTNLASTNSGARWVSRMADASQFAGRSNVQVRFLFNVLNAFNNQYKGWFVDDVKIYEAARITSSWVRDNNGRAVQGALVQAMGRGGITNLVDGHSYVLPGKVIGEAVTAEDGSFTIKGLPLGNYYVKASAEGQIAEFWDGVLFTNGYAFGNGFRPGVTSRDAVSTNGILRLVTLGSQTNVHFELERGSGRASLGVVLTNAAGVVFPVVINGVTGTIWNGSTSSPAFQVYTTSTNMLQVANKPDWITNAILPNFMEDLSPGVQRPVVTSSNVPLYPLVSVNLREGEYTVVGIRTNQAASRLYVTAANNASYAVQVDGRILTNRTPAVIPVHAGLHDVTLVQSNGGGRVGMKFVTATLGGRATVTFDAAELTGPRGAVSVSAFDGVGRALSNFTVFVNGQQVPTNEVLSGSTTSSVVTLNNLLQGQHEISLQKSGYRSSARRTVNLFGSLTNAIQFILYEADRDYDRVGDATEINGYTNIFLFHRGSDPDADGLTNLEEFNLIRLLGVGLNIFRRDSDSDRASDGEEVGYDGVTNLFALSVLETNAVQFTTAVRALFVGDYLAGRSAFRLGTGVVASIEGDRFVGESSVPSVAVPTKKPALIVFTNIVSFPAGSAVNSGHVIASSIFADGMPDEVDSDGDTLWDGFEYENRTPVASLDLLHNAEAGLDPDYDGLTTYYEFLGIDGVANTNDWTKPGLADTDGDFMPDGWEYQYTLNPLTNDASGDLDGEGLINLGEYLSGTHPRVSDTDADYLPDYPEVATYLTNPNDIDTDGDGLLDGREVWDLNLDGIQDGGVFPMWNGADLDFDGFVDGPTDWDTDGDGMPDGFEVQDVLGNLRPVGLNPYNPTDGDEDADGDGLSNLQEYLVRDALYGNHPTSFTLFQAVWYGQPHSPLAGSDYSQQPYAPNFPVWDYSTDPFDADTDNDGMPDGYEVVGGLHPADPIYVNSNTLIRFYPLSTDGDLDADGLWNTREYKLRFVADAGADSNLAISLSTLPWQPDTDGDGLDDGEEHHALRSNPVTQDTDKDRLMDGTSVTGYVGEVESSIRRRLALVDCPGCSWEDARLAALTQLSPDDGTTPGQLAVIGSAREWGDAMDQIAGTGTNVAIGIAQVVGLLGPVNDYAPINGEPLTFQFFYTNLPSPTAGTTNGVVLGTDGLYRIVPMTNPVVDHFLVEWETVPVGTNHYDQALNDLWQLTFPTDNGKGLPYWTQIVPDGTHDVPQPRWGHSMNYVPAFESKNQGDGDSKLGPPTHILLDNRKLVVIGGRDGVDKYGDVWEYWIKSNAWTQSARTLPELAQLSFFQKELSSGISEHQSVLLMGYRETSFGCDVGGASWDREGIGFGEPKNRPWNNGYQRSSYDGMYILGGWNDEHNYLFNEPMDSLYYKSTDDLNPIVEESRAFDNQGGTAGSKDVWQAIQTVQFLNTNGVATSTVSGVSAVYGDLGFGAIHLQGTEDAATDSTRFSEQVPLGAYVSPTITITNSGSTVLLNASNVASAIRILRYPFKAFCDNVVSAELVFTIQAPPAGDLDLFIVAEYQADRPNNESVAYDLTPPPAPRPPLTRAAGSSFVTTNSLAFTIPAGTTGSFTTDVTTILQEVSASPAWLGYAVGFVITNDASETDFALMLENSAYIRITHIPSYRGPANWLQASTVRTEQGKVPSKRKSFGMVYNYIDDKLVLFGGMNGREVFDETYEAISTLGGMMPWVPVVTDNAPPARWGHSMVYDDVNNRVLVFGGFDKDNKPLNDLWEYGNSVTEFATTNELGSNITVAVTNTAWREITEFQDTQRPSPRGGAMMVFYGGDFYDRGSDSYAVSGKRNKVVIFGGTDGTTYFNDLWVYDEAEANFDIPDATTGNRWILADPGGEQSPGPSPRAFGQLVYAQNGGITPDLTGDGEHPPPGRAQTAAATVYLFGGRNGTLPTGKDTDRDLVDDGQEHELGGPAGGRDPRINALYAQPGPFETIPFTFRRIGTWGGTLPYFTRPAIADLESLSYHERLHGWRMGLQYVGRNLAWQGYPLETTHEAQTYVIGNESVFPVEDPNTNRILYITGVDAYSPDWTNMWFHRHGVGDPQDIRDVWQLGRPDNSAIGSNAAPPYAYSGRWVYGTDLNGSYPRDALMELYSPIVSLTIPPDAANATDTNNANAFFLVFHEWLDLADTNDVVRVDVVRPTTPADIATRVTGLDRPVITLLPNRNKLANTAGTWRRVIVPLNNLANESNLYFRFTLQSDDNNLVAGGWYIDDVAVIQGSELGGLAGTGTVQLLGVNFNNHIQAEANPDGSGSFNFGLLPLGNYQLVSGGVTSGPYALSGPNQNVDLSPFDPPEFMSITGRAPFVISWDSVSGIVYRVDSTTNLLGGTWTALGVVTGDASPTASFLDTNSTPYMYYRVSATNAP